MFWVRGGRLTQKIVEEANKMYIDTGAHGILLLLPLFSCPRFDGFPLCYNGFIWNARKLLNILPTAIFTDFWDLHQPGEMYRQDQCSTASKYDSVGRDLHSIYISTNELD